MKRTTWICIVLSIGLSFACTKKDKTDNCIDQELLKNRELVLCPEHIDPVCGCDGKTYSNECVAKFLNGVKYYTRGACNCEYPFSGTVKDLTGLDGCELVIQKDNGENLEVASLPPGFVLQTGARVLFNYTEVTDAASICMVGPVVEIDCIRYESCLPITPADQNTLSSTTFKDPVTINSATISQDCLYINFSYGGGCVAQHDFRLLAKGPWCGTPPVPPIDLHFEHESHGDLCQAYFTKTLMYDLKSIRNTSANSVEFFLIDTDQNYHRKFIYTY